MQDACAPELVHPDGHKTTSGWGKNPHCLTSSRNEAGAGIQSMKKHMAETLRLCLARLGIRSMKSWLCVGKRLLWFISLVKGCTSWLGFTLAVNWEEWEWERALLSQNYEGNLSKVLNWGY